MASDPKYAREYYEKQLKASPPQYSRRCHDCGKPTNDYRCPACWRRIRAKLDIPAEVDDLSYEAEFFRDDGDLLS